MGVQVGDVFDRLTVISFKSIRGGWCLCSCVCGQSKIIRRSSLLSGMTKSCGCLRKDNHVKKHGCAGGQRTPEYRAWQSMCRRCLNPKDKAYANYGGRGITICSQWIGFGGFETFLKDLGPRTSLEHSLDRYPNNNGNYEPLNCRWATRSEQMRNQRPRFAIENVPTEILWKEIRRRLPEYEAA